MKKITDKDLDEINKCMSLIDGLDIDEGATS